MKPLVVTDVTGQRRRSPIGRAARLVPFLEAL